MRIGIVGTGNMGRSIGLVCAELGHDVCFGARERARGEGAVALAAGVGGGGRVRAGDNDVAAEFGEVVFYTPRGVDPAKVLSSASLLDGKIVVDINNQEIPDGFDFPPIVKSLAETLADKAPKARVVKAFNTIGMEVFELCPGDIVKYRVAVFVAADDEPARRAVLGLAGNMGFVPIDCGPLRHARLLEGAADFIRFLMIDRGHPDANISLAAVPPAQVSRLGGRQDSQMK